jgi:predicted DNA-binding transcriptional regulator YafY
MGRSKTDSPATTSVTLERASRLARLLKLIAKTARTREALLAKLHLDVRGFYRDLKLLRDRGVLLSADRDSYRLLEDLDDARAKLPAPDPMLSVADLKALSKGTTDAHKRLRKLYDALVGSGVHTNGKH